MKFLKKHIKIILIFVVSTLIVSMVSVYATYSYLAQDVSYTKSDGTEVSVKDALDELYLKSTGGVVYKDSTGTYQKLSATTAVGTKIGSTTVDGQSLNWYLFDVSDDGKTAYLVSTPTYWAPDTTKEVSGAWVPKLVSNVSSYSNTGAMRQAIQKLANGRDSQSYNQSSVSYNPSPNTLSYYKSVNSQWSAQRGSTAFANMKENEQEACYLADGDIFAGIKNQVNNADGNLKGKIQTLVGGASIEQWCKAYNKQTKVKEKQPNGGITCEYSTVGLNNNVPGYIYKVNGIAQNSGWETYTNTIFGNDIYGAAYKNGNTSSSNPFYSSWWLASPSSNLSYCVCYVRGNRSYLKNNASYDSSNRVSLFASVAL